MAKLQQKEVLCQVCKEQKNISEVLPAELVRGPFIEKIMETHPDWSSQGLRIIDKQSSGGKTPVRDSGPFGEGAV